MARPSEDLYDTSRHPFLPVAIHRLVKEYIVLPISSFHRLAEECGHPTVPVELIETSN